jgi:hypothetical protein
MCGDAAATACGLFQGSDVDGLGAVGPGWGRVGVTVEVAVDRPRIIDAELHQAAKSSTSCSSPQLREIVSDQLVPIGS